MAPTSSPTRAASQRATVAPNGRTSRHRCADSLSFIVVLSAMACACGEESLGELAPSTAGPGATEHGGLPLQTDASVAASDGASGTPGAPGTTPPPGPGTPGSPGTGTIPAPPTAAEAYRSTHPSLFVDLNSTTPTQVAGNLTEVPPKASTPAPAASYEVATVGPSYTNVEQSADWRWAHPGGDWLDKSGVAQGPAAHFEIAANAVASGQAAYTVPLTEGAQAAFARGKWNAYIVKVTGGGRALATHRHSAATAPRINVTYGDGTTAVLPARACVQLVPGTAYTRIGSKEAPIDESVALEFEMPTKPVKAATLTVTVTRHTASASTIKGYLANPPANNSPVTLGVAANYPNDLGLKGDPSILFAQRYEDGTTLADYILNAPYLNVWDLSNWDPELFGTGAANPAKLPTAFNGTPIAGTHKWFLKQNTGNTISVVPSTHSGDGFAPSSPGLGAMRIVIPRDNGADGASVGYGGSTGSDLWALFPKAVAGLLDETYVRFRVRFAVTPKALANTKAFRTEGGATATYAIREGKWGLGTHHWTFFGGNNNVGGDNLGHTNRLGFRVHPSDVGLMGVQPYVHSWDMIKYDMPFGAGDGLGAAFYPNRWYWVEVRKKLNTYNASGPVGSSPADGVMEVYIDGRLAARHTNWKYRDGKLDYVGETPIAQGKLVPFRQMGDMGLLLNLYNGGVKAADEDTVMFFAQVACGTSYIGLPK